MTSSSGLNCYNDVDMKSLSTSMFSFEYFRERDLLYVDKTSYVHKMVSSDDNFFFLSRPRRFGKSLLCSTLHALFDGRKDLFEGLYIEDKYSFEKFPVLHFNFAVLSTSTYERFENSFVNALRLNGSKFGIELAGNDPADMLYNLLYGLQKRAVVIIDEFDAPITTAINEGKNYVNDIRSVLNDFYSVIKNSGECIRFFFMTGVTKLSNLSIFSSMNNLVDISMDPEFAGAFGYTDEELDEYFGEGIDENWSKSCNSREEFREKIREYYDGYRFSPRSEMRVYNPVSIGRFFKTGCVFENYWMNTGETFSVVNLARNFDLTGYVNENQRAAKAAFILFDLAQMMQRRFSHDSIIALLYYSGYLTITGEDEYSLYLSFPNKEIRKAFISGLVSRYTENEFFMDNWTSDFVSACRSGNENMVREKLEMYFSAFSYELIGKEKERFFQSVFHAIFVISGIHAVSEDRGLHGRADEAVIAGDHLWIFELKVDGSAEDALIQIEQRGYAAKYSYLLRPGMTVHKVGMNFSSELRNISEWKSLCDA